MFARVAVGVFALALVGVACRRPAPTPPTKVVIETGGGSGVFNAVGTALGAAYERQIPKLTADIKRGRGLEGNADDLERGTADLAFVDSETAYVAYRKGTTDNSAPHTRIRAIGVLFPTAVHLFVRGTSGIKGVAGLKGKRIMVGPRGSDSELAAALILEGHRMSYQDVNALFAPLSNVAAEMQHGSLDAVVYYVPFHHQAPVDLTTNADVHLLPIGH